MKITVKVQKKTRAHLVLFCKDTPFKAKIVANKKAYTRKDKHKGRKDD
jgi:hypothetical protein